MTLRFEEPSNLYAGQTGRKWAEIFHALRCNPGEWALVAEMVSRSMARQIKLGKLGDAKPGEFEAVSRGHDAYPDDKADIYARYVEKVMF